MCPPATPPRPDLPAATVANPEMTDHRPDTEMTPPPNPEMPDDPMGVLVLQAVPAFVSHCV